MPSSRVRWLLRDETGVAAVLVLLVLVVGIAEPGFLTRSNLTGTAHNACYVGLMAAGMVFALAMREVDLSVGAVCIRDGWSPWAAAAAVLVLSALLGACNAIVARYVGLPTFIVTLATAMVFRGIGLALADGKQISGMPQEHAFFLVVGGDSGGLPTAVWVLLATTAVLTVLLTPTRFGAQVRAVGSNPDAALFTGRPIVRTRIKAMALSASTAGLAAVLALALFIAGDPTIGQGYELSAIAAAIIGGTPLAGARGSVPVP
ncbi:ABC transporter permease [Streptomyces sp. NPDC058864]